MSHITTKQEERNALQKIREILETLEPESYVRMAITPRVLEMAAENIEMDFGNSPDDAIEYWQKTASEYREELFATKEELEKKTVAFDSMGKHANKCEMEIVELKAEIEDLRYKKDSAIAESAHLGGVCDKLENENIRLKAKLYDMMMEKEVL